MKTPNVKIVPPPKPKTMAEAFAEYLRVAYKGVTVGGGQYVQLRRAFYAGMWEMLNARLLGPTNTGELTKEYMAFLADVATGKA